MTGLMGTQMYVTLPLCLDGYGHRFTIPPASSKAVCERCGLIRKQPNTFGVAVEPKPAEEGA